MGVGREALQQVEGEDVQEGDGREKKEYKGMRKER